MESVDVGPVVHVAPNESGKLSGDCDHGLVVALGDGELSVTTGQAQLRCPGVSVSLELVFESQANRGWDRKPLPPATESVRAALEKLACRRRR